MSRWTENKFNYRKNYDIWTGADMHIYQVKTDQKTFIVRRRRLDYKQTLKNLTAAGYTGISFLDMGRDVTIKY